jgi:hypothetical protein
MQIALTADKAQKIKQMCQELLANPRPSIRDVARALGTVVIQTCVLIDNTCTAVAGINQMGTCHSRTNHRLACRIWEWCIAHNIWPTAAHIPGIENITADRESRVSRRETEWQLNKRIYSAAIQKIGVTPNIGLFASRLNFQIEPYISYQPDPYAMAVNAFSLSWAGYTFSALLATGLIIVPYTGLPKRGGHIRCY